MTFLINEQNVSAMYIDINAILYLDLNIFQQDEYFCSRLGMEIEHAKSNLKTCFFRTLLPIVRVGQNCAYITLFAIISNISDISFSLCFLDFNNHPISITIRPSLYFFDLRFDRQTPRHDWKLLHVCVVSGESSITLVITFADGTIYKTG